jgi:hypothetical protein
VLLGDAIRSQALSEVVIRAMVTLAGRHVMRWLLAPVHPTLKHRYLLMSMPRCVRWRRADGARSIRGCACTAGRAGASWTSRRARW